MILTFKFRFCSVGFLIITQCQSISDLLKGFNQKIFPGLFLTRNPQISYIFPTVENFMYLNAHA